MNEIRQKSEVLSETPDAFKEAWEKYNSRGNAGGWEKVAFVKGFGAAWQAAYEAGEIAMKEKAARESKKEKHMKNATGHWLDSNHAQSEQIARAIRALPLSGAEESTK